MSIDEVSNTVKTYKKPKTILGFFAIVLAIVGTTGSVVVGLLVRHESLHGVIPWILAFFAVLVVGTLLGVFFTAWKDPTILMLGQVTGTDYIANRRLTLGDSDQGEFIETVPNSLIENSTASIQNLTIESPQTDEGDGSDE